MKIVRFILAFFAIVSVLDLNAQNFEPALTQKHLLKIEETENPVRKLKRYNRYYHRDSIREVRESERYWDAQSDSISQGIQKREKAFEERKHRVKDGINTTIYKTVYKPWAKREAHRQVKWLESHRLAFSSVLRIVTLNYFIEYFLNATQDDAALAELKSKMPEIQFPAQLQSKLNTFSMLEPDKFKTITAKASPAFLKNRNLDKVMALKNSAGKYAGEINKHNGYIESLKSTENIKAKGEQLGSDYLSLKVDGLDQLNGAKGEFQKMSGLPGEYKLQFDQLNDSTYIREQAKKKAEELAANYIAEHPEITMGLQQKMNLLMKKYSVVPNSTDLKSAIKRSSLEGRTFKERLILGGNFQIITIDPFTIDLSPIAGYRFDRNFSVGIGGNYRQTFGDCIPTLTPSILGYKVFTSYDIVKDFFAYAEFDRNSPGVKKSEISSQRIWKNAAFLGIGRKFRLHQKLEMTTVFMYNFLYEHPDPIYPKRWNIKIGFQTSDLAFFKPKNAGK